MDGVNPGRALPAQMSTPAYWAVLYGLFIPTIYFVGQFFFSELISSNSRFHFKQNQQSTHDSSSVRTNLPHENVIARTFAETE